MQLMVYTEVVPTICRFLDNDRRSVRRALSLGGGVLFIVLGAWSMLGIALSGGA